MNDTLKTIGIATAGIIAGATGAELLNGDAVIEPTPIVREEVQPNYSIDTVFIEMPDEKVKVQAWSEQAVNTVQGRIQNRITSLQARKAQLMSDDSPEAQDELINVNKELEMLGGAEAKM